MIYQVLIVDDEEIVCRGLAQFVKWKKYGFESCCNCFQCGRGSFCYEKKPY